MRNHDREHPVPEPPSILFINRVFPPDRGASGRCLADLAGRAARAGWRVTVLCDGQGPSAPPHGVTVLRAGGAGGARPAAAGYLAALARLTARALTLPRHDVVVTMTDPPLLALAGPVLTLRHGAALHWCLDLFPALLPVLGLPRLPGLEMLMGAALRGHRAVVAIGRCMAGRLRAMGVADHALSVLPNWGDPAIRPLPRLAGGPFTVLYAGNFGLAHPLGALLEAAAALPEVEFLLVGDGRGHGVARAAAARLPNIRLLPFQPAERLSGMLAGADLHVAAMDPQAEGLLVPCKAAGALAAGRPCLFLGPAGCEAARVIVEHGCGAVLDPGDTGGLVAAIGAYAADPGRCAVEGARGLAVATAWNADTAAAQFLALAWALTPASRQAVPAWRAGHG